MNTITIELCKEDRKRLDDILTALAVAILKPEEVQKARTEQAAEAQAPAQEAAKPEPEATAPQQEESPAEPTEWPPVTRADIQQLVVQLSAAGKKAEVKEIVTAYAPRVSGIPEDKFVEVWQKLTSIEG